MVGSLINRRGVAIGVVVGVVFVSVVLNFLEPFMRFTEQGQSGEKAWFAYFSLLNYFRPVDIVRSGQWPVESISVLLALATTFWIVGLIVFSRKDIPAA